jgi:hypothetical protein
LWLHIEYETNVLKKIETISVIIHSEKK